MCLFYLHGVLLSRAFPHGLSYSGLHDEENNNAYYMRLNALRVNLVDVKGHHTVPGAE